MGGLHVFACPFLLLLLPRLELLPPSSLAWFLCCLFFFLFLLILFLKLTPVLSQPSSTRKGLLFSLSPRLSRLLWSALPGVLLRTAVVFRVNCWSS